MAKPPQSLAKYTSVAKLLAAAEDSALVSAGTLKAMAAWLIRQIPIPGAGMALRPTPDGDVWTLTVDARPFQISSKGKVHPGLVGGLMPTLDGEPLDTTENVIDLTDHGGNFAVWFTLNFSVTYLSSFLSSYTLSSVTVDTGTSVPADDDDTKHLQFNTITDGKPIVSYFATSLGISLYDNGANATGLHYATA